MSTTWIATATASPASHDAKLRIAWPDDHPTCGIRLELMIRACDDIQREITELDRPAGAPPAKQRRGLRVLDGGRS